MDKILETLEQDMASFSIGRVTPLACDKWIPATPDTIAYYLHEVNIEKKSSGGIRGHRYFDLLELSKGQILPHDSIEDIAKKVSRSSFE